MSCLYDMLRCEDHNYVVKTLSMTKPNCPVLEQGKLKNESFPRWHAITSQNYKTGIYVIENINIV